MDIECNAKSIRLSPPPTTSPQLGPLVSHLFVFHPRPYQSCQIKISLTYSLIIPLKESALPRDFDSSSGSDRLSALSGVVPQRSSVDLVPVEDQISAWHVSMMMCGKMLDPEHPQSIPLSQHHNLGHNCADLGSPLASIHVVVSHLLLSCFLIEHTTADLEFDFGVTIV